MSENNVYTKEARCREHRHYGNNAGGAVYGLGLVGAAIYFISHAATFWMGVLGLLKAIIWPVFAVYWLFDFLKL